MIIWEFYIQRNMETAYVGCGSLEHGLSLYDSLCDLHTERDQQVDSDMDLLDSLSENEREAVNLWLGHTSFTAEGKGMMNGHKALCLCCKEWRNG